MASKSRYQNRIRIGFQIFVLGLIAYVAIRPLFGGGYIADFEAYCPFGGIASLGSKLNQGTMSCTMGEIQVMLGIGLLVGAIVVGKLFCSYVCPIGSISEWLGKLGEKWKLRFDLPNVIDRPMRLLKYVLLFLTLYFTMTSSELFCKEFDPYFASTNLFQNTDIVLYFAIPATLIAILGAIFLRLFWCKYLCPLGAISNIFLNVVGAGAVIGAFVVARLLGAEVGYEWLLAGLVLVGVVTELGFMRSFVFPAAKITRVAASCTDCGICDDKCPQGIQISKYETVTHSDCTLCTDCVYACPLKNTLTISKQKTNIKYLAPAATIVLVALSLGAASNFEFTTIAERWGGFDSVGTVETFQMSGLKNVKCFSSAMSVKSKLQSVHGIYGVDAYASSHTIRVYYNPAEIAETKVKAALFSPAKQKVREAKKDLPDSLAMLEIGIYKLFDLIDFNNLFYALRGDEGVFGFETHFGEPVMATIFFDPNNTNAGKIRSEIEAREVVAKKPTGVETISLNFSCEDDGKVVGFINAAAYRKRIFKTYDRKFNGYEEHDLSKLNVLVFPMPEADVTPLRRFFGSLSSHLSADDGVVRLSTRYFDEPSGLVYFDPTKTSVEKIRLALTKPKLTVFKTDTETQDIANPFHIKPDGVVKKGIDVAQGEEE
ncbi:MAG: 4Fe-4S binding protein [Ignavibacteriae bacterium]|nr:4Fe-4S binding protein [Ignavibacteriota bacterium]